MFNIDEQELNMLVSYAYICPRKSTFIDFIKKCKDKYPNVHFILDSGAFTAKHSGMEIKLNDYANFVNKYRDIFDFALTLDVIGDEEGTWKNFFELKNKGLDVMPIFTVGQSFDEIEKLYEYTDYIGIGSIKFGANISKDKDAHIDQLMKVINGRKCHWLGVTSFNHTFMYHPASMDSSSWLTGRRFGAVTFMTNYGLTKKVMRTELLKYVKMNFIQKLHSYDLNLDFIGSEENWRGGDSHNSNICVLSYIRYGFWLQALTGTKFYHAINSAADLKRLLKMFNILKEKYYITHDSNKLTEE